MSWLIVLWMFIGGCVIVYKRASDPDCLPNAIDAANAAYPDVEPEWQVVGVILATIILIVTWPVSLYHMWKD